MDKKPEKLVPEVRFKGFTDDWEQRKFDNVVKRINDKDDNPELPHIEFENIISGNGTLNKNIKDLNSKKIGTKFQKEDILFGKLRPYLKNWYFAKENGIAVGDFWVLRAKKISVFVYYLIQTEKFYSIANLSSGSKMPRSDWNLVSNSRFNFPENTIESIKIGNLILQLDKLITLQQRKLKQLERLKTAMLQQLLANQRFPKVRFNDFKDSWKDYRLGEVFDEFSVKSKRENEYKLLSSTTSGMESRSGRVSGHSNIGYKVIDNGDIVLSPQNLWLGNINLNNMGKGIVSPSYHTFKIVNANPIFVNFQLKTEKMLFEYKMVSVQGASVVRRNLDMDAFKKIVIKIPNEKEQIKIASLFSSISNIINNHQNKLTQLSTLKKCLYKTQKLYLLYIYMQKRYNYKKLERNIMILSFADKETEKIFEQKFSKKLPQSIQRIALRKLIMIDNAENINDLRIPPANHLEQLSGDREGQYSIRINNQFRICFTVHGQNNIKDVEIVDYH